jgi:hypothetical protein
VHWTLMITASLLAIQRNGFGRQMDCQPAS